LLSVYLRLKYGELYDSVLATPIRPTEVELGEIGWALLRGTAYALAFTLVMVCTGLVGSLWAVLAVPVAVLIGFSFAAIGMTGTTYMKSWQDFDYVILASTFAVPVLCDVLPAERVPASGPGHRRVDAAVQGAVLLWDLVTGPRTRLT
jgi:lipooligosaccharide transport system permease protein